MEIILLLQQISKYRGDKNSMHMFEARRKMKFQYFNCHFIQDGKTQLNQHRLQPQNTHGQINVHSHVSSLMQYKQPPNVAIVNPKIRTNTNRYKNYQWK